MPRIMRKKSSLSDNRSNDAPWEALARSDSTKSLGRQRTSAFCPRKMFFRSIEPWTSRMTACRAESILSPFSHRFAGAARMTAWHDSFAPSRKSDNERSWTEEPFHSSVTSMFESFRSETDSNRISADAASHWSEKRRIVRCSAHPEIPKYVHSARSSKTISQSPPREKSSRITEIAASIRIRPENPSGTACTPDVWRNSSCMGKRWKIR